jgi:hypothetical protein
MPRGVPKAGFRNTRKRRLAQVQFQVPIAKSTETIPQIEVKLKDRFDALEVMAEATGKGINRSLIVSGPAGLGKSYTVEQKMAQLERKGYSVNYIKGYVRPLALYKLLYESRFCNSVLVFDDADSIFHDDVSMNLLKGACDSNDRRVLYYLSKSLDNETDEDGESVPEKFEFEGSIIFITNYDFDNMINSGNKLAPHFEALVSRSHYLDLAMKTKMDYLVRIKQVVREGMLKSRGFDEVDSVLIMQFIESNMDSLRELSLRMVCKISSLYKMDKTNWQKLAKQTCFRVR